MQFKIKNRWTGEVIFTAEIDATEDTPRSIKLGLAVRVAVRAGAYLADADLARAYLARANLAGANLARANLAGAYLADADLARAYLAGANLAGANLAGAYLADAYLADADLAGANLADANLARAYLAGADLADANLARAYLAGAKNFDPVEQTSIPAEEIPVIPNIDAAILAAIDAGGKLDMGTWHKCKTTHCRAGWAITLGGEKGAALESRVGPLLAGCMIYSASRPGELPPHFFATDEAAMADLKACAARQAAPNAE